MLAVKPCESRLKPLPQVETKSPAEAGPFKRCVRSITRPGPR